MKDRPLSIKRKSFPQRAKISLSWRLVLSSLLLIALPLLIHTLFLYRREYKENQEGIFYSLHYLAESRVLFLEELIHNKEKLLHGLGRDFLSDPQKEETLKKWAAQYETEAPFYAKIDPNGKVQCEEMFCADATFLPLLKEAIPKRTFSLINPHATEEVEKLYVGYVLENPQTRYPEGMLVIEIPTGPLLLQLEHLEKSPYPLRLSLIDEEGHIFTSTQESLKGRKIACCNDVLGWTPSETLGDAWVLREKGKDYLAIRMPIRGTDFTLLLDVPEAAFSLLQIGKFLFRIFSLLLLIFGVGGGILFWWIRRMNLPLRSLFRVMQRVSEGASHSRFSPDRWGFEINFLGQQFNQMLDLLQAHQKEIEKERIGKARVEEELKIGKEIQSSILPSSFPSSFPLETAFGYLAAKDVSGDFYDFFRLKDGRILIVVADAAGKGIPACLYSLGFRSMLRTAAATLESLEAVIKMANSLLLPDTSTSSTFITAWIGFYDPTTQDLIYCSLGHPPGYLHRTDGTLVPLGTSVMALGVESLPTFELSQVRLNEGDVVFLYSDGITEAHDLDAQMFGKARLLECIQRLKKKDLQMFVDQLLEEVHLFCAGAPQLDDMTAIAFRAHSPVQQSE